jgi:hypothetical protein
VLFSRPAYTGTRSTRSSGAATSPAASRLGSGPGTDLGLRSAIISQQRAAFLGVPIWGSDTGGYYQFKDREVFARWLEFSAFSGSWRSAASATHAPWNMPTAPAYDQELIDIYRRYANLRVTLQPYIVAAGAEAASGSRSCARCRSSIAATGSSRPLGPVPLRPRPARRAGVEGRQRSRSVYFPSGTWRSYWDASQTFSGPRRVTLDVPLDTIPVFVRDGAVVPGPVTVPFTGGCACGAVRYECAAEPFMALNCHCRDCQRASGSAYASGCSSPPMRCAS